MEIRFKTSNLITTAYIAPISDRGWFTAWAGRHTAWKYGFVVRALWFGWVLRWGYVPFTKRPEYRLRQMIEQANDGDYLPTYFSDE